ncbi:hypothetical protein ACWNYI_00635 [Candidatus Vidania fulgoroideorum]
MILFKELKSTIIKKIKIDCFIFSIIVKFISLLHPICPLFSNFLWMSTGLERILGNIYNYNSFKKFIFKKIKEIKIYINGKFIVKKKNSNKIECFIKDSLNIKTYKRLILKNNICNILL